ncbi:MAG: VOC family protein [Candidatus Dormibacteraceae bacterium]
MSTNRSWVELHVPNFEVVKEFYGKLGFQVAWEDQRAGSDGYLVMQYDELAICFWPGNQNVHSQPYFRSFPPETRRGYGVEIIFTVRDLDALYRRAQELDSVVEELKMKPWGLRDFRLADPYGYYLRFNEPHDPLLPAPLSVIKGK